MLNLKMLNIAKKATVPAVKCDEESTKPVSMDEINDALDDAAAEIDDIEITDLDEEDEIADCECDFDDPDVEVENAEDVKEAPDQELHLIYDNNEIEGHVNDIIEETEDKFNEIKASVDESMAKSVTDSLRSTGYAFADDETCSVCGQRFADGDIIQFERDGNIHHACCKNCWGEFTLTVETPTEKINLFGEDYAPEILNKNHLKVAKLNDVYELTRIKNGVKAVKFAMAYSEYITRLNAEDTARKACLLKKDAKCNVVKIEDDVK